MGWCKYCAKNRPTVRGDEGYIVCTVCGRVNDADMFSTEATFIKGAGGQSSLAGSIVKSIENECSESRVRTLAKGRDEISYLVTSLDVGGGDFIINQAHRLYNIAVDRNFTKGRRTSLVAAACLYIACRENKKAFLLIDFSEELRINVYVLGAVFLQLCQLLRLEEHPIVQKPVDPSLFIHRFTERLLGGKNVEVSRTALRILASMKRDWMQTGRKPSGLCGAALYISALSHGLKCSKSDIGSIVHICEATLTKRLIEFENTESGSLTIEEFNAKAEELEIEVRKLPEVADKSCGTTEILCEHKDSPGTFHFRHGLCKSCYDDFYEISGGLQGGSEPPAFQEAERKRMAILSAEEHAKESSLFDDEVDPFSNPKQDVIENETLDSLCGKDVGFASNKKTVAEGVSCDSHRHEYTDGLAGDESETLSDIDDVEVAAYLHNEDEKRLKKIIWEEMNKEYLEEQRLKKEAEDAAKKAYEANFQNCPKDLLEIAAAAKAEVAKSRKERQQKRAAEAKNAAPAQNAAEATLRMLNRKRLSSKINQDVLDKLFDHSTTSENIKKKRIEPDSNDADEQQLIKGVDEYETDMMDKEKELDDQYGEEYNEETYGDGQYYENAEEDYGYYEDYD